MASKPIPERNDSMVSRTEEIAAVLKREILMGQYRPGERLPSERDLSKRFETSRGTVREVLKKLEQLGIASIQLGGARVVPIEKATLEVLAALIYLRQPPDPKLVDQVMEVYGVLMELAAKSAVTSASDDQVDEAIAAAQKLIDAGEDGVEQHKALRRLGSLFIEISEHIVLQLVFNGLQTQFIGDLGDPEHQFILKPKGLAPIIKKLQTGLKKRNATAVTGAMKELDKFIRKSASEAFHTIESKK